MPKILDSTKTRVRSWTGWYRHITRCMLAQAFLTGICQENTPSTMVLQMAPDALPLLPLTAPARSSSAWTPHLACSFFCAVGSGLVLVAQVAPKSCQLFPHQTSSEGKISWVESPRWAILMGTAGWMFISPGNLLGKRKPFPTISGNAASDWSLTRKEL